MWFGWGWGFMLFVPVCLILIAIGLYYVFTSGHRNSYSCHTHTPQTQYISSGRALEILKERYAKGEITREQYQQMKNELT